VNDWKLWLTLAWFLLTYTGLAIGKLPWLRTDRTGVALVGATLVVLTGLLGFGDAGFDEAIKAIDFQTIALLLGMMVVVGCLREAGFFERLADWVGAHFQSPLSLLAAVFILSGVLSAILVNDVVCLALTPLVLHMTRRRRRLDPRPHLIGLALASNIGSTATPTGNPQNVIIDNLSHIPYLRFAERLAPIAIISLVVAFFLTAWIYRGALKAAAADDAKGNGDDASPKDAARVNAKKTPFLVKSLFVTLAAVVLFFLGMPMHLVALGAAAILLLDRFTPAKVYKHIDWGLLLMFAGLFVVVHAFEVNVVERFQLAEWPPLREHPVGLLSVVSAVLSNIVSNVPAVLLFKPIVPALPHAVQESAWLALAMSSTLAGNLTVLGSVANLIVVEQARKEGVTITFWDYCRIGVPVTLITLAVGIAWLVFVSY